jgi:hypothetical protein
MQRLSVESIWLVLLRAIAGASAGFGIALAGAALGSMASRLFGGQANEAFIGLMMGLGISTPLAGASGGVVGRPALGSLAGLPVAFIGLSVQLWSLGRQSWLELDPCRLARQGSGGVSPTVCMLTSG